MFVEILRLCSGDRIVMLAMALMLALSLAGCSSPKHSENNRSEAAVSFSDTQDAVIDAEILSDAELVTEFVKDFARAYFVGDNEKLLSMLVSPYDNPIEIYDGTLPDCEEMTVEGAGNIEDGQPCMLTVLFKTGNGWFCSLNVEVIKTGTKCEVSYYGIE